MYRQYIRSVVEVDVADSILPVTMTKKEDDGVGGFAPAAAWEDTVVEAVIPCKESER